MFALDKSSGWQSLAHPLSLDLWMRDLVMYDAMSPHPLENYLYTSLLKSVSRSFYLSLRFLPKRIRKPLSLAYLLARTTDTLADTLELPISVRIEQLTHLQTMIGQKANNSKSIHEELLTLKKKIMPLQTNKAEYNLIDHLDDCLDDLAQQPLEDKKNITQVLSKITAGQLFDLNYFGQENKVKALTTEKELDTYMYNVAGCVGEFWTKLCFTYVPNFSSVAPEQLMDKAINFGKGLQLTNILRDLTYDLKLGRLYLPINGFNLPENLNDSVTVVAELLEKKEILNYWRSKAFGYLNEGWMYIGSLTNKRIRFACMLPLLLALSTLRLMSEPSYLLSKKKIKVDRKEVYRKMLISLLGAHNQKFADHYYQSFRLEL